MVVPGEYLLPPQVVLHSGIDQEYNQEIAFHRKVQRKIDAKALIERWEWRVRGGEYFVEYGRLQDAVYVRGIPCDWLPWLLVGFDDRHRVDDHDSRKRKKKMEEEDNRLIGLSVRDLPCEYHLLPCLSCLPRLLSSLSWMMLWY